MSTVVSVTRLRWLLLALGLVLVVRQWAWMPTLITGESMAPTLHGGQLVVLNKLAFLLDRPRRAGSPSRRCSHGSSSFSARRLT